MFSEKYSISVMAKSALKYVMHFKIYNTVKNAVKEFTLSEKCFANNLKVVVKTNIIGCKGLRS